MNILGVILRRQRNFKMCIKVLNMYKSSFQLNMHKTSKFNHTVSLFLKIKVFFVYVCILY